MEIDKTEEYMIIYTIFRLSLVTLQNGGMVLNGDFKKFLPINKNYGMKKKCKNASLYFVPKILKKYHKVKNVCLFDYLQNQHFHINKFYDNIILK